MSGSGPGKYLSSGFRRLARSVSPRGQRAQTPGEPVEALPEPSSLEPEKLVKDDQGTPRDTSPPGVSRLANRQNKYGSAVDGSVCDIICLDARYNKKGDYEIMPSTSPLSAEQENAQVGAEYAIMSTRYFDQKGKHALTKLKIRSPHLLKALKSVAPYYPTAPVITETKVAYETPYRFLLHCHEDLKAYRQESEDDIVKQHVSLLVRVIELEMKEEINELAAVLSEKKITYPLAWTIFRPGTLMFTEAEGAPEIYRVYLTDLDRDREGNFLRVVGEQIDFDGKELRTRMGDFRISEFTGVVEISSLSVYPLRFHSKQETIVQSLVERGHKWYKIQKDVPKTMTFVGISQCVGNNDKMRKFAVSGRIVVDGSMFDIINPEFSPTMAERTLAQIGEDGKLTDKEAARCTAFVRGYSLNKRLWGYFDVSLAKEVEWLTNSFDRLILRSESKEAIKALVKSYIDAPTATIMPDLIQGKGCGMVFLLHGPPGVGKTLTAETIAEHLKRPLYVVSGGELGTTPESVDRNLSTIMEVATAWKAVVLIDEADVFLQKRDLDNLERNSLVSIFLRQLEYYEGLMFLTTNRVNCIDEAFRSRIDVSLNFPNLTVPMRRRLWEDSLSNLDPNSFDIDLKEALPLLEKEDMNGREIRKTIKAAKLMAGYYDKKLTLDRLQDLMNFRMVDALPKAIEESDSGSSNLSPKENGWSE